MYKLHYDKITGIILGSYPNFINYSHIPTPYIEVSDEDHNRIFSACDFDMVRIRNNEFVFETLTLEEQKQSWLDQLNRELESQLKEISVAFNADLVSGLTLKESQSISKAAILQVMTVYEEKVGLIESGVHPSEEEADHGND